MKLSARDCWKHILNELGMKGQEFSLWGAYRSSRRPFTARATGNYIVIEGPSISSPRTISYTEFECVFGYYEDYVNLVPGMRPKIRDRCGLNSSYIITLIHEFCQG